MQTEDRIRLQHMRDAARDALSFAEGKVRGDLLWDDIIAMRHRLVHAYYDVNLDIVWRTLEEDLPPLVATLDAHLAGERPSA